MDIEEVWFLEADNEDGKLPSDLTKREVLRNLR